MHTDGGKLAAGVQELSIHEGTAAGIFSFMHMEMVPAAFKLKFQNESWPTYLTFSATCIAS